MAKHNTKATPPRTPVAQPVAQHNDVPAEIWPNELETLPQSLPQRIRALTLDCFDTLLWRNVASPTDVFFDLAQRPAMHALGLSASMRIKAEAKARSRQKLRDGSVEVTLEAIYRTALPDATTAQIQLLMDEEIAAEARACKAFPATVALIRAAHARGLPVYIVSDTYLAEPQLRELLNRCLPADTVAMIHRIFCSSAAGVSKARGLFKRVIPQLALPASAIVHIGDHPVADGKAPRTVGIGGIRLRQHDATMEELHRLTALVGGVAMPELRQACSLPMPYRGVFGALAGQPRDTAATLGALTIGPVMHAFAQYLQDELDALRSAGHSVKPAFLLRDGHLPERAFTAWHEAQGLAAPAAPRLAISRFIAYGASFRSVDDIDAYLAAFVGSRKFADFARQLLLPDAMIGKIVKQTVAANNPEAEFVRLVHRPEHLEAIFAASAALRHRLFRYLQRSLGMQRGDTLVFIDLGYEGTAQRLLAPVLRDEAGVTLIARYLIASPTPGWQSQRAGLLDASWCDERAMMALVRYIALLEDLCTAGGASVIDYTEAGEPVLGSKRTPAAQVEAIAPVQQATIEFVRRASAWFAHETMPPATRELAQYSLLTLTRLLHAPTEAEINYLAGFQLDMGLGTDIDLQLFDLEAGQRSLRERGLHYMEQNLSDMRMNTPHELRAAGLELALTHFAYNRFALDLYADDMRLQRESVAVIALRGDEHSRNDVQAQATFEGWFALHVPMGGGDVTLALALGERYRSLQIESVSVIALTRLHSQSGEMAEDASDRVQLDGISLHEGGVALCEHENALLVIHPPAAAPLRPMVYRIVFRPLARR